jgi:hypothetical protein
MQVLALDYKRPQRLEMIRDALQEKAPKLYRQLKRTKKLEEFVAERERAIMENYDEGETKLAEKLALADKTDPLKVIQEHNMADYLLWKDILETWLEFPEEETIESQKVS